MEHELNKRLAVIRDYAWQLAGEQVNRAELYMRRNPDQHPEFQYALQEVAKAEQKISKLADDFVAEEFSDAYMSFASSLAMECYLRGVMDGARLYHAIIHHEIPAK